MVLTELTFLKRSMMAPVEVASSRPGAPVGISVLVVSNGVLQWALLADQPGNQGVSVTNGANTYAAATCDALSYSLDDMAFFTLDSTGCFDQLSVLGGGAQFSPLIEDGFAPRSLEAFMARADSLFGVLPPDAEKLINKFIGRFVK